MNLRFLAPLIIVSGAAALNMLMIGLKRNARISLLISVLGLLSASISLWLISASTPVPVTPLFLVDINSTFFCLLISASGLASILLGIHYFKDTHLHHDEYFLAILLAVLGSQTIVLSAHFASFLLGLEILSISLFLLIAYPVHQLKCLEASLKYFILATVSTSLLIFGAALLYTSTGSLEFKQIFEASRHLAPEMSVYLLAGLILFAVGIAFKLSLFPFHMWSPDVYEGSPAPVTALIATASKTAVVAFILRSIQPFLLVPETIFWNVLAVIAIASMTAGNLLALYQNNLKRILAYSSIAHMGYLLVAILADTNSSKSAVIFYMASYTLTNIGAFGIISAISKNFNEPVSLEDISGLLWKRPWISTGLSLMVFSLAGIPLTAGFFGKFLVLSSGIDASHWILVLSLVINSTIGIFYYLRIIISLGKDNSRERILPVTTITDRIILLACSLLVLWFGVFPNHVIKMLTLLAG